MDKKVTRRLSAIMFTDIVGYSSLMQQSEARAAEVRALHRKVFEAQHEVHNGKVLQYYGDGTLSVFQSGVHAVECAIAIQKSFQEDNKVPLRIGLHLGDIVYDDTEVYGDSVNLASRIESLGVEGSVLISRHLNDELKNHPHISTVSMGFFDLKNIDEPIEIFAVKDEGITLPTTSELKGNKGSSVKRTIAVLPFVNMSSDPENEYFSDGMTEEIINALAKIKGLKVTSRTSSFHFKNKNIPIVEIGCALNVSTILEGSIRLSKNKMRITAQLIDVEDDFHFWSETFDRSVDDIFEVQDEISLLIADKLREHIGHFDIAGPLVTPQDVSVDNYKRYLQGRFLILKMAKSSIEEGIGLFENIIEEHPNYTFAHLGIHLAYTLMGNMGYMTAESAFAKGMQHLHKAIELDENLPECQLHLSYDAFIPNWDLKKAYAHLQKSFEGRPSVEYYQSMASFLVAERKFDAALYYINTAIQIDPFHFINFHLKGFIQYCQEKFDAAIPFFEKALEINPGFVPSKLYKGQALILMDDAKNALEYFQNVASEKDEDLLNLGGRALAHAALGNTIMAKQDMASLENLLDTELAERALLMLILCKGVSNQKEETIQLIEKAISLRLSMLIYLFIDPILKFLHEHEKFKEMMQVVVGDSDAFQPPKRKYKKSLLDPQMIKQESLRLQALMDKEKPFLNPELTLRSLAEKLDLQANYMSQLLNEGFEKNFSEFINTYRLEHFKTSVIDPSKKHLTLLGIAFESGFNSKTVFNTFFKKQMGKTPKAYLKEISTP